MAMRSKASNTGSSSVESYDPADGLSEASSQERPPTSAHMRAHMRLQAACFAKYKLGGCTDPSCSHSHDLNPSEISAFLHYLEQTHHVVFPDSSSDPSTSDRLDYDELQKSVRERFRGMSEAMLMTKVPLTKAGNPSSMGSVLHSTGKCRPCRNMFSSHGCPDGVRCLFCHQEHTALSTLIPHLSCVDEDAVPEENVYAGKPSRFRPSKAKRDYYKETVKRLEAEIQRDPFGWSIDSVAIPAAIASRPSVKQKLLIRLALMADTARASQMQGSTQQAIEAETAPPENDNSKKKSRPRQLIAL